MENHHARPFNYKGEEHLISEWAKLLGIDRHTVSRRIAVNDMTEFEIYYREHKDDDPLARVARPTVYINDKIRMLENDFWIRLTKEEKAHFRSLKTECAVDQYAHDIIMKKL